MTVAGPTLVPDENVRANSASYTANGKGLDVSDVYKRQPQGCAGQAAQEGEVAHARAQSHDGPI